MIREYRLKNGEKRYSFQIYIGTDEKTGKQRRTTRRGFKTRKEAELQLARLRIKIDKGEFKAKKQNYTFRELYEIWIESYEPTVEESTFVKTETIFRIHLLPAFGDMLISKITIDDCQKKTNEWAEKYKSYRKFKAYASRIFDFAITRDLITRNPFDYVITPRQPKEVSLKGIEQGNFYTREELINFLECAKKDKKEMSYPLFYLLAFTGMRKGEALALTWGDINFSTKMITIDKALGQGKDNRLYPKAPKTGDIRFISIDKGTIEVLLSWKDRLEEMYTPLGFDISDRNQLVFPNTVNGYLQLNKTNYWIKRIQRENNLKEITTHGLRHTHCTLLFEAGASLQEVQDRLGHSDSQTTYNIYTHITAEGQKKAVDSFSEFMKI